MGMFSDKQKCNPSGHCRTWLDITEILSDQICFDVRTKCANFTHLLPDEFDCEAHYMYYNKTELDTYTEHCSNKKRFHRRSNLSSSAEQCARPPASSTGTNLATPVVNNCYLPCRTTNFEVAEGFHNFVYGFCVTVTVLVAVALLKIVKPIKNRDLPTWAFVFVCLGVATMIYYGLWSIFLSMGYFQQTTVCELDNNGVLLRLDSYPT
ncbi:unnamed protein product [Bursaphelenchus okinawaensis]|uniref:Uncharacterized protein n=1 Tax=Bursaphelenchus okinawaensis TaxID=465554 RepID=A0A811KP33_9BILA|nr:unnamed protein product [Bursaphelenchus okinawaensis]CAG9109593.1 unnamed protein product [Bursaphelenchus okinawaensis]